MPPVFSRLGQLRLDNHSELIREQQRLMQEYRKVAEVNLFDIIWDTTHKDNRHTMENYQSMEKRTHSRIKSCPGAEQVAWRKTG